jgi:hypothetical protein
MGDTDDLCDRRDEGHAGYAGPVDKTEQIRNNVLILFPRGFGEGVMVRSVLHEPAALASLALFLGMVTIWVHVLVVL